MQYSSTIKPGKLNMDVGRKYLPADSAFYLLNHDTKNPNALGKGTPHPGNYPACEMEMPGGENYRVGSYSSERANESYAWIYNSNGVHFISRINSAGECEVVYDSRCLVLSPNPAHEITQSRAYLRIERSGCVNRHGKNLIWVDGNTEIPCSLDVEASIATNSFTTPYFTECGSDPCEFLRLCVPGICGCLQAQFVPLAAGEEGYTNNLVDVGIKLMVKHEYYDGRMSEWSDRSSLYYQDSRGCFDSGAGFSRCLKVRVPLGNPMVTRVHIAFNKSELDEAGNNVWYETEVVEKYKKYNSSDEPWYKRELAELPEYSSDDCSFDYLFCNDKQCKIVDPKEVSRVTDPVPRYGQGMITIKDAIGIFNYISGNCPIDKAEVEKVKIGINCTPDSTTGTFGITNYQIDLPACVPEIVTVTVRAIIYNDVDHRNQFVYRMGGDTDALPDDDSDTAYFGGISNSSPTFPVSNSIDQAFSGTTRNFIAYVEGTDIWGEMSQKYAGANFTNVKEYDVISGMTETGNRAKLVAAIANGAFFYQEVKLQVRRGTRGFIRLTSHKSTGADASKSTFVGGQLDIRTYAGYEHLVIANPAEEIYFDACGDSDIDIFNAFVVMDYAGATAFNGYVTDANGRPVEGAIVDMPTGVPGLVIQSVTDHNGFYHLKYTGDELQVKVEQGVSGNFTTLQTDSISGTDDVNTAHDIIIENENYKDDFYQNVLMGVTDCDNNPVGGIRVALSGAKYQTTGGDGFARFRIRNYQTRDREVRGIAMDHNGCFLLSCGNECNPCFPTDEKSTPTNYQSLGETILATAKINIASSLSTKKGLKAGGNYPMAMLIESPCGKISAAYELPALRIPSTQDKGQLSFCDFTYDATGITLPFDGCMKILRGANLNTYELQWMVDKIERVGDGKIKLTIQSLNDYDAKYFFKTNTIYQYLKGDRIEFIRNGDGKIFTTTQYGLLNYLTLSPFHDKEVSGEEDAPADFFNQLLIQDDGRLDNLTVGAVIELQRIKECTTEPAYFDICVSVPIVDGKLLYEKGKFTSFDTYLVNRTLTYQKDKKTSVFPGQTFEHHSPSDFWGDHLDDTGKAYFVNKFETEKRFERSVSINASAQFNYFGDLEKTFDAPEQGAIVAMNIVDGKIITAICEHDVFSAQTADELVRVGGDGVIRALSPDQIISDAQPKVSGTYGCAYAHVGSIFFGDGYSFWADVSKGHYIIYDYNSATIAGMEKGQTTIQRYSGPRFQALETSNRGASNLLDHYRFSVGFNRVTKSLHVTIKTLREPATNNEKAPFLKKNETLIYHPPTNEFLTFHSATPEGYGSIDLFDGNGCAMIMYFGGIPYILPIVPKNYNEFFGIACDWIVGIVLNQFPTKIKIPLACEIESSEMWFSPKDGVTTEDANFLSEIPPVRVKKNELKWNAAFLSNVNSRGGLYNGGAVRSYQTGVLLMRDQTDDLKYNSVNEKKQTAYGEIDLTLIKFAMSEQSGQDLNL